MMAPPVTQSVVRRYLLSGLILAGMGVAAYSNSFQVPFQFDDLPNITQNADNHILNLAPDSLARAVKGPNGRRPVAYLSFAINYLIGKTDPFGYHLVNLIIHILNAFLVLVLTRNLMKTAVPDWSGSSGERVAFLTALLFLLHPVQTQAVTYIVQRMTSLAALFSLLSVVLYLTGRQTNSAVKRSVFLSGAAISFLLGLATKENTAALPIALLLVEWLFFPTLSGYKRARPGLYFGGLVIGTSILLVLTISLWPTLTSGYAHRDFTLEERLLTQPRVIFHYLSLLALPLPSRFHLDYDFPVSLSLLEPVTTLISTLGIAGLIGLVVLLRKASPLTGFSIGWFLITLAIESSVVPLEMVFEHRVYLPSIGPLLLVAWGAEAVTRRSPRLSSLHLAIPVLLFLATVTWMRNEVWRSPQRLYEESARLSPNKWRTHQNVGWSYYYAGDYEKAEAAFLRALEFEPRNATLYNNLGNVYRERGNIEKAIDYYRKSILIDPALPDPRLSLSGIFVSRKALDLAERELLELLKRNPSEARAFTNLGAIYWAAGNLVRARQNFDRAVELDPGSPDALIGRAKFLASIKLTQAAEQDLKNAVIIARDDPSIWFRAGMVYEDLGNPASALDLFTKTLQRNPGMRDVNYRLGNIYVLQGDLVSAEQYYEKELALGTHSESLNNLGNIAWSQNQIGKAREYYQRALTADPNNDTARTNLQRLPRP